MTTFSELQTQIRSYTETSSDVLTDTIVNDFILQAARQDITGYDILKMPNETIKEYIDFLNPWVSKS